MANFPTSGDDVIFGTDESETIDALGGDDLVFGGLGNDILRGNTGDDMLAAGLGLDVLNGGRFGSDTAFYGFYSDGVTADLLNGFGFITSLGKDADGDQFVSIENLSGGFGDDVLRGNSGNNKLAGNSGNDTLDGREGNDTLTGGNGNDIMYGGDGADSMTGGAGDDRARGGAGADTMSGGDGIDTLDYAGFGGGVAVSLQANTANGGDAAGDIISGFENLNGTNFNDSLTGTTGDNLIQAGDGDDVVSGLGGKDYLRGLGGKDSLIGGSGDDLLEGGAAADTQTGGTGADKFTFSLLSDSGAGAGEADHITDFEQGIDKIDLGGFDAVASTPASEPFVFIGDANFGSGVAGEVRAVISNGKTFITLRTQDSGGPEMRIVLDDAVTLNAFDFIL